MSSPTSAFGPSAAADVRKFFGTEPTALVHLPDVAASWGLAGVYVKDESTRFGQQAFKVPGATYAMAKVLARRLGIEVSEVRSLVELKERCQRELPGDALTFVTCTDGNHGRAVAWAAKQLGQKAIVYMPKGSAKARVDHVLAHGAECMVTELNYDQTVDFASSQAEKHGWTLLQDTTLPGYIEIPTWIMQGYTMLADEAQEQFEALEGPGAVPSHIFLQVGVGSLAGAVLGYFVELGKLRGKRPRAVTLEPKNAACLFASAERGELATVDGDLETMIAGLACGVPSSIGWPILAENVDGGYCWMEDGLAGNGMRLLAKHGVEAGECGGAGIGLLQRLMTPGCPHAQEARRRLGLDGSLRVLLLSTEGATDPENYREQMRLPDVAPCPRDFGLAAPLLPASLGEPALKRRRIVSFDSTVASDSQHSPQPLSNDDVSSASENEAPVMIPVA